MLFVYPASTPHHTIRSIPHSYDYSDQGYYQLHPNVPQFATPLYPASQQRFFHQPTAEELEEREYQQALSVISNYRRRQAEKEAAICRQRQAAAARQRYIDSLTAELEQQRQQAELLASHRAKIIRTQQARARLAAAERQFAANEYLGQLKGAQPVCSFCNLFEGWALILSQATHRFRATKPKVISDALKQPLTNEPHVTESTNRGPSVLGSHPALSEKPKDSNGDSAELIGNLLSSLFPGLVFHAQPRADADGKAQTPRVKGSGESTQKSGPAIVVNASGSPNSPTGDITPSKEPDVAEPEQPQVDHTIAFSSIEQIRNSLTKLQNDFVVPAELDHYAAEAEDHDETASVSSVSSSDLTKLIPCTNKNKPVYKYENELNGLLEALDRIESHGDVEVRERRKEVVKAVESALEGIGRVIGGVVEKTFLLASPVAPATEQPPNGFDVDDGVAEGDVLPSAEGQVGASVAINDSKIPEHSTPAPFEAPVASGGFSPAESNVPPVSDDAITTPRVEPSPSEPDVTVPSAELDTADAFLLLEDISPPSPVEKPELIDSDNDDLVLVLDNDEEKSDWSEIEG